LECPGVWRVEGGGFEGVRVEDVRAWEGNSGYRGYPLLLAMESAGEAVASLLGCVLGGLRGARVAVLAGRGGNGGDGLAAARRMALRGARVDVYLAFGGEGEVSREDVRVMLRSLRGVGGVRVEAYGGGAPGLQGYDAVVDALLGVGSRGAPRGAVLELLRAYNGSQGFRLSVDVPSGVDADTGEVWGEAARSDATLTMHWVKRGLLSPQAAFYVGDLYVAEIGFPDAVQRYAGPGDVAARIPGKPGDARKGDGGRVLVVGGSEEYVGAPIFAALGALAAGADLVYLAAPFAREAALLEPEIIPRRLEEAACMARRVDAVVVGPGLGLRGGELLESVVEAALEAGVPTVIDADGLKLLPETRLWRRLTPTTLLTPHRGEARRLLGLPRGEEVDPEDAARRIAALTGATVLVKAPVDAACDPEGRCRLNDTGHPAMSSGGTGDVLAGLAAGIAARRKARGLEPDMLNTAATAAFIAGAAGERLAAEEGDSLLARDLAAEARRVIAELKAQTRPTQ